MTARTELGSFGERVAGHRLEAAGLEILARNVRVPGGEIDIVARDAAELVFVEVRTRRALPGSAAETLGPEKLRRMWRCAMAYCDRDGIDPAAARVDLVSIDLDTTGRVLEVEHFRGLDIPDED